MKLSELVTMLQKELVEVGDAELRVGLPTESYPLDARPLGNRNGIDFTYGNDGRGEMLALWMMFDRSKKNS
jgi:hypothetical protein